MAQLFNPRSLSPSASPLVSPLLRSPVIQAALKPALVAQNRWSDPYALAAALGSLGEGYGAMNKELAGAATAQKDVEAENTRVQTQDDLRRAFQAAKDKLGANMVGTPEFSMAMHDELQTMEGYDAHASKFASARKQLQMESIERQALKDGMERAMTQHIAQQYFDAHAGSLANIAEATQPEKDAARQRLSNEAFAYAKDQVKQADVQPVLDPVTRTWSARNSDGQTMQVPTELAAQLLDMSGVNGPWKAMNDATTLANKAQAQNTAALLAGAHAADYAAQANKANVQAAGGAGGAGAAKAGRDPMMELMFKNLTAREQLLSKEYENAFKNGDTDEMARLRPELAAAQAEVNSYHARFGIPTAMTGGGITTDQSTAAALGQLPAAPAAAPTPAITPAGPVGPPAPAGAAYGLSASAGPVGPPVPEPYSYLYGSTFPEMPPEQQTIYDTALQQHP